MGEAQTQGTNRELELCTSQETETQHFKMPDSGLRQSGIETHWDYYAAPLGDQLGWSIDIEPEGLLLRTLDPIPERRWIRLRFRLPHSGIPLITTGQVLSSRKTTKRGLARFESQVRFRAPVQWIHPSPPRYLDPSLLGCSSPADLEALRMSCSALLEPILDSRELQQRLGLAPS